MQWNYKMMWYKKSGGQGTWTQVQQINRKEILTLAFIAKYEHAGSI